MDDLINRQAAIDVLNINRNPVFHDSVDYEGAMHDICKLPSAVVRCGKCKWWDQKDDSPYGYCHAMKHAYYSSRWEIGIYRTYKDNWFCADGERKDNG